MTKNQALKILIEHNAWRRDQSEIPVPFPTTYTAKELGQAIDVAIRVLEDECSKMTKDEAVERMMARLCKRGGKKKC